MGPATPRHTYRGWPGTSQRNHHQPAQPPPTSATTTSQRNHHQPAQPPPASAATTNQRNHHQPAQPLTCQCPGVSRPLTAIDGDERPC